MGNTKEIKNHIGSVKSTQKITNAMYLIAETKMRRARQELAETEPYFDALRREMGHIFARAKELRSRYVSAGECAGTYAYVVVTADRGLAGAYNQNIIKQTLRLLERHPESRLFVIGDYGRQYFAAHHIPVEQSFLYTAQNPNLRSAREVCALLLEGFDRGDYQKIYMVYTDFEGSLDMTVRTQCLLPIEPEDFAGPAADGKFFFEPSAEEVLASVVPGYLTGFLYSAVVESFCSEQSARAAAMDAANQNAQELLDKLQLEYNHERQGAITREITEVSAGARAKEHHAMEARSHE